MLKNLAPKNIVHFRVALGGPVVITLDLTTSTLVITPSTFVKLRDVPLEKSLRLQPQQRQLLLFAFSRSPPRPDPTHRHTALFCCTLLLTWKKSPRLKSLKVMVFSSRPNLSIKRSHTNQHSNVKCQFINRCTMKPH